MRWRTILHETPGDKTGTKQGLSGAPDPSLKPPLLRHYFDLWLQRESVLSKACLLLVGAARRRSICNATADWQVHNPRAARL